MDREWGRETEVEQNKCLQIQSQQKVRKRGMSISSKCCVVVCKNPKSLVK